MYAEDIVRAELDADPLGRGYSGMSDQEVYDDLVALTRETWNHVSALDILEVIIPGHWNGLMAAKRKDVDSVLSMGSTITFAPGSRADVLLTTAFTGNADTLTALATLAKRMISRAEELNCGVSVAIVTAARALEA